MIFDIHSHILPAVDDGAENLSESVKLLEMMKSQGITECMATPHFYSEEDSLSEFKERVGSAYDALCRATAGKQLPNIYLGCELLYFEGIGNAESVKELCLNETDILLLELTEQCIDKKLFADLTDLRECLGITPLIAHVERYKDAPKYRKFLKFLKENNIRVQVNATSVLSPEYKKTVKKIINRGLDVVLATDAHSTEHRPPMMDKALAAIEEVYGRSVKKKILKNSETLYKMTVERVVEDNA